MLKGGSVGAVRKNPLRIISLKEGAHWKAGRASTLAHGDEKEQKLRLRLCVSCRQMRSQSELIRLGVDHLNGRVVVNHPGESTAMGRSAYLCRSLACVEQALKGTRLKVALEGRKRKETTKRRTIQWPLEPQLILVIKGMCTEPGKTCQNTKEGGR